MSKRVLVVLSFLAFLVPGLFALGQVTQSAGEVTAQIPEGLITRPKEIMAASVGVEVLWNDLLVTRPGGRLRVTLRDTSVLNVGPGASLRVTKHDLRTGESEITLTYGKMRSRLAKESDQQKFEVKTNTAVLGVVGTDFFTEATLIRTAVIVYEGVVRVRSLDPSITGETLVHAGEKLEIGLGQPPGPARPASAAELNDSLRETEVGPPLPVPSLPALASGQLPTQIPPPAPSSAPATPAAQPAAGEPGNFSFPPFSADQIVSQGGQVQSRGRIYMHGKLYRMEMEQAGQKSIAIMRGDRGVMWVLMPAQNTYMEMPLQTGRSVMEAAQDPNSRMERELLGTEKVGPYSCRKYRVRVTSAGHTWTGIHWLASELNDFPVRMLDEVSNFVTEYQNISLAPPDPAVFELPPGYRKMTY
jgi:outer membrane lipoprotein-sorting protein